MATAQNPLRGKQEVADEKLFKCISSDVLEDFSLTEEGLALCYVCGEVVTSRRKRCKKCCWCICRNHRSKYGYISTYYTCHPCCHRPPYSQRRIVYLSQKFSVSFQTALEALMIVRGNDRSASSLLLQKITARRGQVIICEPSEKENSCPYGTPSITEKPALLTTTTSPPQRTKGKALKEKSQQETEVKGATAAVAEEHDESVIFQEVPFTPVPIPAEDIVRSRSESRLREIPEAEWQTVIESPEVERKLELGAQDEAEHEGEKKSGSPVATTAPELSNEPLIDLKEKDDNATAAEGESSKTEVEGKPELPPALPPAPPKSRKGLPPPTPPSACGDKCPPPSSGTSKGLPPPMPPTANTGAKKGLTPPLPPPGNGAKKGLPPPSPPSSSSCNPSQVVGTSCCESGAVENSSLGCNGKAFPVPLPQGKSLPSTPTPKSTTKNIFWEKVDPPVEGRTLWFSPDPEESPLAEVDQDLLEKVFAKNTPGKKAAPAASPYSAAPQTRILDAAREKNVGIILQFLRMTPESIAAAIDSFDEESLNPDRVASLVSIYPNDTDINCVKVAKASKSSPAYSTYSLPVKFFVCMLEGADMGRKLRAWNYILQFDAAYKDISTQVQNARKAAWAVKDSHRFAQFLRLVLAAGNFLNRGTHAQNAKAFRVGELKKLSQLKSADGSQTMLGFIVDLVSKKNPDLHAFTEELSPVHEGFAIELPVLTKECSELKAGFKNCSSLHSDMLAQSCDSSAFCCLNTFVPIAQKQITQLEEDLIGTREALLGLAPYLGERSQGFSPQQTLTDIASFCKEYEAMLRSKRQSK